MSGTNHRGLQRGDGTRVALLLALGLALAGCGDGGPDPASEDDDVGSEEERPDDDDATGDGEGRLDGQDGGDRATDPGEAAPEPDLKVDLTLTPLASMDSPTAADVGPDGRLYVAERAGTVHPLTTEGPGDPVVDVSAETTLDSERGLLGIAFAADGRALYLSLTGPDGETVLLAVAVEDGRVVGERRREVFTHEQPYANHNGGHVSIGPDDLLYLGLGDGGAAGDPLGAGQDLSTPLGSLLRIDPQGGDPYAVPESNPFVDVEDAAPEIFAYGLRNPWRFSFDPETDALWIGDVGQDAREEINRVALEDARGANFGWNLMEGTGSFAGSEPDDHVAPIYEYETRGPEGCAVTGGVVYRGEEIPELTGVYLYADSCNGMVRGLRIDDDGQVAEQAELGIDAGAVVSFATDPAGEVLVLDLDGGVYRIDPA
ncbi:MAG: PQQ-dependent sugar dehydrogenase [Nitriliruptoraceae bacterium]